MANVATGYKALFAILARSSRVLGGTPCLGTLSIFLLLAAIMVDTRMLDWYRIAAAHRLGS